MTSHLCRVGGLRGGVLAAGAALALASAAIAAPAQPQSQPARPAPASSVAPAAPKPTPASPPAPAPARPAPRPPLTGSTLEKGRQLYARGQYSDAVDTLRAAVTAGVLSGRLASDANALVACCMIRMGSDLVGREVFKGVLREDPQYRPANGVLARDEAEVFAVAVQEFEQERVLWLRQGAAERWHEPASVGFAVGFRQGQSGDVEALVSRHGGQEIQDRMEWSGAVRIPVGPRVALQIEAGSLEQKAHLRYPFFDFDARVRAVPVVASLYWRWREDAGGTTQLFAGGGPVVDGEIQLSAVGALNNGELLARETGYYLHAGVEREILLGGRIGFSVRALGRIARTGALDLGPTYGGPAELDVNGRKISFQGFALQAALLAHIGN